MNISLVFRYKIFKYIFSFHDMIIYLYKRKRIFRKILQFRRLTFTYLKKKKEMLVKFILG